MGARRWMAARLVASAAGLALPSTSTAANYTFVKIADSAQFNNLGESGVSLNNLGTVAFTAGPVAGGQGVFTGAGGPITTIIEDSEVFNFFRWASINDSGMVAFSGEFDGRRKTILASNGGPVTTIAETTFASNGLPREVAFPVINSQGVVAFRVFYHELDPLRLNFAIYAGSGGPLTLIANSSGPLSVTNSTPLHMNDSGAVAFAAVLDGSGVGIFAGNGGPLTTIVTSAAGFAGFSDPSINASGTVAFSTQRTDGVRGIFTSSGGPVTTIADSSGPFSTTFGREALINASGQVAFRATLDAGGAGIFTGPDPIAHKVIQTGDPLFGSTVTVVGHASASTDGDFDINDNGEIAFRYELANGAFGIAVASLVPEPSPAILLAVSVLAAWRSRFRRR